jgi:signal transduction histidine kinase
MTDTDHLGDLRHALANPLAALLTEAQLALTAPIPLDQETRRALQEIEKLALRMRGILKESYRQV